MSEITVRARPEAVEPCPHCGSRGVFTVHSEQVAEDHCHVWAVCGSCGYDPTSDDDRIEDVWGGARELAAPAILFWNEKIQEQAEQDKAGEEAEA